MYDSPLTNPAHDDAPNFAATLAKAHAPAKAEGDPFYAAVFPERGSRFCDAEGTVWQIAKPLNGEIRHSQIFAVRGSGLPGQGYFYKWFTPAQCQPYGATAS